MLRIAELTRRFAPGTASEVLALDRVGLSVAAGEFVCVIGSNGAGKSTLLNCVAGTIFPDEGSVWLAGRDITRWPEYRRAALIGRVFQDPLSGTCATMTIGENLALAARRGKRRTLRRGVTRKELARYREILSRLDLGLENRLNDLCGLLSGGQRQALTLLMATLNPPMLLLLDEHTAALDPKTAGLIMKLTCELVEENSLTAIMITHNMQQALTYGSRLIMMHRGAILLDFPEGEKSALSVPDLMERFHEAGPPGAAPQITDRMALGLRKV